MDPIESRTEYEDFLADVKNDIKDAQLRASLAVSSELVHLYWCIGRKIIDRQIRFGWGAKVIDQLATDLRSAYPGIQGYSRTNLLYMRAFAETYPDSQIVQQLLDNFPLPWGHHVRVLDKVKDQQQRFWYIKAAHEHGWSRSVLEHQIQSNLYSRQGQALTNFHATLPPPQSDLAQQILKDPYNFDFLTLAADAKERHLERGLLEHIREFLLKLGAGFSFVGSQYHLEIGQKDYYIDLLFYHLRLRCFVVIDLKMEEFKPEFAGKMNFYLSAVDDLLRHKDDAQSIGIVLCKTRDHITVEYALRNTSSPIGVAEYLTALPDDLADDLPTVQQLEAEFGIGSAAAGEER